MMHYFIDGYNLLFYLVYQEDLSLEMQRDQLIHLLNRLGSHYHLDMTLVFDAKGGWIGDISRHHFDQIEIIYTKQAMSADAYILHELARKKDLQKETVVTSDKPLAQAVRALGAKAQSIKSFLSFLLTKRDKKKKEAIHKQQIHESPHEIKRLLAIFEKKLNEDPPIENGN